MQIKYQSINRWSYKYKVIRCFDQYLNGTRRLPATARMLEIIRVNKALKPNTVAYSKILPLIHAYVWALKEISQPRLQKFTKCHNLCLKQFKSLESCKI